MLSIFFPSQKKPDFQTKIFLRDTRNLGLCSDLLQELPDLRLQQLHLREVENKSYLEMLLILSCLLFS